MGRVADISQLWQNRPGADLGGGSTSQRKRMNPETQYDRPTNLQDGWSVGDPAQFGLDPILLQDMKRRVADGQLDNVHAIIVARNGVLLYEQYAAGLDQKGIERAAHAVFDATTRHNGNSMTKSVISLLVGIAFRRGWIEGLDTPVLAHFPEY